MLKPKTIFFIAGEASGDQHGAGVIRFMKKKHPELECVGIGGGKMEAAGMTLLINCKKFAFMGLFIQIIKHLPVLWKTFRFLKNFFSKTPPDLLILIDYSGFNLRVARLAKRYGIKVLYYVSPQVWAWRTQRVKKLAQYVDHLAVIFPFEKKYYSSVSLPVTYVGNPLIDEIFSNLHLTVHEIKQKWNIDPNVKIVGLLPGSRRQEVEVLMPIFLKAAENIKKLRSDVQFILPLASSLSLDDISSLFKKKSIDLKIIEKNNHEALNICDAVIVCSGIATLEAALLEKPMVIVYRLSKITAFLLKCLLKVKYIGLCNIIAGKKIVPELLQNEANANLISETVLNILKDEIYRTKMIRELKQIKTILGSKNASEKVAQIAFTMLNGQRSMEKLNHGLLSS